MLQQLNGGAVDRLAVLLVLVYEHFRHDRLDCRKRLLCEQDIAVIGLHAEIHEEQCGGQPFSTRHFE